MQFTSTGGIFLRLDSSGNLNIYDTTGTTIAKFIGGVFGSSPNYVFQSKYGTGQALTQATGNFSMGVGATLTNIVGTQVQVLAGTSWNNGTASVPTGAIISLYKNTTGVPALGTSVGSDTLLGAVNQTLPANISSGLVIGAASTVTVGTATSFYLAYTTSNLASQSVQTAWLIALGA